MRLDGQLGVIPWEEFEKYIRDLVNSLGSSVSDLEVSGKRKLTGLDGEYEIDASVVFNLIGVKYLTLIECKCYKSGNTVSRDLVMVLNQKIQSLGAQKGIIFTTSDFQSGAISFAKDHGIALVKIYSGEMAYVTNSYYLIPSKHIPPSVPKLLGYIRTTNERGVNTFTLADSSSLQALIKG